MGIVVGRTSFVYMTYFVLAAFTSSARAQQAVQNLESPPSLFSSDSLLEITFKGPIYTLFQKAPGLPPMSGKQSNDSDLAYEAGSIEYRDTQGRLISLPMEFRVRGNSSQKDCSFPKLSVRFKKETVLTGTLFAGLKSFKIGTHCGDIDGNSGKYKRLRNQLAPNREALAYRILETLEVTTLKARPGRINYVFTDARASDAPQITRNAMFLESDGQLEKRLGAVESFPQETYKLYLENISRSSKKKSPLPGFVDAAEGPKNLVPDQFDQTLLDAAMVYFGNGILYNHDWDLKVFGQNRQTREHPRADYNLWNVMGLVKPDGTFSFAAYDLDLSGVVIWPDRSGTKYIDEAAKVFARKPKVIQAVKARMLAKREAVLSLIQKWDFSYRDPESGKIEEDKSARRAIKRHMEHMFDTLQEL